MEGERRKRVVFTISGSNHDGPQMLEGLKILSVALRGQVIQDLEPSGRLPKIEEIGDGHYIISCHRNPETLAGFLNMIADAAKQEANTDFVLVMGAGWAAALPGVAAGYLYHHHGAKNVFVVAAAFESNPKGKESITPRGSEQFVLNSVRTALEILAALNAKQRRDLAAKERGNLLA